MSNPISLDVAFLPVEVGKRERAVAIVVDVLRASSTIITLCDRGCRSIGLADSIDAARQAARSAPIRVLLCGEVEGLAPYGFDHGNSPVEFSEMDLTGRHVVMATTNGTAAVRAARDCGVVLVGALLNTNAAVREAFESLRELQQVVVVCAGRGGRFVLDDAVTAGFVCHVFLSEAKVRGLPVSQTNSAAAAYRLYHSYPNLTAALNESDSARALRAVRMEQDVSYCAKTSVTRQVPRLRQNAAPAWEEREGLYLL